MSASINKAQLLGRLGEDPQRKEFQNGGAVVNLRIATSETWKENGERRERTDWHSVAITNEALGKVAMQYLRKGSTVYVEGQMRTRKWQDQRGNDRYLTELVVAPFRGELKLMDPRGGDRRQGADSAGGSEAGGGSGGGTPGDLGLDDEVPF
jgi:single-strand DNA-binding protein